MNWDTEGRIDMFDQYPIYTILNDCRDCCKCIRNCPVKAIGVENGSAQVTPGLCIVCGKCVEVCPAGVKVIRNDLDRVIDLLSVPARPVYVSLSPSWVNEFPGTDPSVMVKALIELGFRGVSETALGAEQVAAGIAKELEEGKSGLMISSSCPSVVEYIEKYNHKLVPNIVPVISPLMAHCKLLKRYYGDSASVVHIGPCPAAKLEADKDPGLLYASITFLDLKKWLDTRGIEPEAGRKIEGFGFAPYRAMEGRLYSIGGGLISDIKGYDEFESVDFISISGIDRVKRTLDGLDPEGLPGSIFLECLACPGGCVNGPCSDTSASLLSRRMRIERGIGPRYTKTSPKTEVPVKEIFVTRLSEENTVTEKQIAEAMAKLGKDDPQKEFNCGGCGYDTCRAFAEAMAKGMTEPAMCVSWMREKAQKKSNALFRSMPSGVVIVDKKMEIVECNRRFAELFGEDLLSIYVASPGLKGADLTKIVPFADHFERVLQTGNDIRINHYRYEDKLFEIVFFSIDPNEIAGAVILDVTKRELRRDKIAQRANEVIQKNITTVQEIACRLGEHMADTEILLRSIAEGYSDEEKDSSQEVRDEG